MEAGALTGAGEACAAARAAVGALDAPWFESIRPWATRSDPRPEGRIDLALLNRFAGDRGLCNEDGRPLRFVEAGRGRAQPYERSVGDAGTVPTRVHGPGMLHDWFNALAWLAFPRTKARLNRLHCDALADGRPARAGRGPLRDAATLLDESGALFVCRDPALSAGLRLRDWRALFVDGRDRFTAGAAVRVLGHGLHEKLLAPYKALCAHAWVVELAPGSTVSPSGDELDAAVAAALRPQTLHATALCPLPLLGVPGWCEANADPAFYDDPGVFRPGRRAR